MSDGERISLCVESLCEFGCDSVRSSIAALEQGQPVAGTEGMNDEQRRQVLAELKAIMAVYDRN